MRSTQDEQSDLLQPYKHRYIDLNRELSNMTHRYILWNMHEEHGDPSLDSSAHPHPDALEQPARPESPNNVPLLERLNDINIKADANIALARLRMDMFHMGKKHDPTDGLPGPVVAMFEAVISGIRWQVDEVLRKVGLWSLIIVQEWLASEVGAVEDCDNSGPSWSEVKAALRERMPEHKAKFSSIRNVLHASHGVLLVESDAESSITFFNKAFRTFVFDKQRELRSEIETWGMERDIEGRQVSESR